MAGARMLGPGARISYIEKVLASLAGLVASQRGHLFHWAPVAFATGIGIWFALPVEPAWSTYIILGILCAGCLPFAFWGPETLRPFVIGLILACLGGLTIGYRAHSVAAPVLEFRFYGAIEGRVVKIDRSLSDKPRLTLDNVVLEGLSPRETPAIVRVSLHGRAEGDQADMGATVILTGHLSPPQGPAEPGGFDFRRSAWFDRIGAVGYTRSPVLELEAPDHRGGTLLIARLRQSIADGLRATIPGEQGGFAAAILTGDRSGISRATTENLRNSSLAHLLSISGLHMALLSGFVFMIFRSGLALVPFVSLRFPTKKIAAVIAFVAASFYLMLSGGATPTVRAYVMTSLVLFAVLLDRRALTLRAIAFAALIILIGQPEALVQPGFQMSFGATVALVVAFQMLERPSGVARRVPKWMGALGTLFLSSLVAGLATAPIAAAHFNRIADFSILANMLSVPVMGSVVMPAAVIAALLWPLGFAAPALWVMEMGNRWILWVAEFVTDLPGAVSYVPAAPNLFLPVFASGALVLLLWQGVGKFVGLIPMVAALVLWAQAERPLVLIADTGGIFGVLTEEGRVLSKATGQGFIARSWLEDDGDRALQSDAYIRAGLEGEQGALWAKVGESEVMLISGRGWRERLVNQCKAGRILIVAKDVAPFVGNCVILDAEGLRSSGSLAGWVGADGKLYFTSASELSGQRLWTGSWR